MGRELGRPLDFTVSREDWCRYNLSDNAILKVKLILTRIHRKQDKYYSNVNKEIVVLTTERGQPSSKSYSQQELQDSIIGEIKYTTVSHDWNEYVADDGTHIKIQPIFMKVSKTSKFNDKGEPIYLVDTQGNLQIEPPKQTKWLN
jgi:hypothetical protein